MKSQTKNIQKLILNKKTIQLLDLEEQKSISGGKDPKGTLTHHTSSTMLPTKV